MLLKLVVHVGPGVESFSLSNYPVVKRKWRLISDISVIKLETAKTNGDASWPDPYLAFSEMF